MHNNIKTLYFSDRTTNVIIESVEYPLTIIEAPMGYGKTTLVRQKFCNLYNNIMWQRVYDNSISSFWHGFCYLFKKYDETSFENLLQLEFPNDSVSLVAALHILEEINLPESSVLVIDDYHFVECKEINKFITSLFTSETLDFHMVLTTRYTSIPNLEELQLKGYLYHITKEDFELHPKDILSYYNQCGLSLQQKEAETLFDFTEGWISALYLIMLNFNASNSYYSVTDIYTLIDQAIYTPLNERSKDLILALSVFDKFTSKQATFIWEDENTPELIEELASKNNFISFDHSDKTYHIHSLIKEFLKERLDNKEDTFKKRIYRNAAKWYMRNEEYIDSMHYAYLAGDFETLHKAFELDKGYSINGEYKNLIIKYFEECPKDVKKKFPLSMLIFARRMFTFNEAELFKKTCRECLSSINSIDDEGYKNRLLGEYELLLSFSVYNDMDKMLEYHKRASKFLQGPSSILSRDANWTFGSPSVLYMFYRKSGELEKEVQSINKVSHYYHNLTDGNGKGANHIMAAERYFNMGDFENSEIFCFRAFQMAKEADQSEIVICAIFLQMRLNLMKGDYSNIINLFKKMHEDINQSQWYVLMHTIDMCEAYMYSLINIKDPIPAWIKNGEFKNTRLFFLALGFLNIVYGRVLLINEEYIKLIAIFDSFLATASVFPNLLAQIYSYIYLAAACKKILRHDEALTALKQAFDMALTDKVYMPFVENYDLIGPLLEELHSYNDYKQDIDKISELYARYKKSVAQLIKLYFEGDKPELTIRETQIAKLVAEGLSNKAISETLFISQNTVKTQLKNIFEKLNINSRVLIKQYFEKMS